MDNPRRFRHLGVVHDVGVVPVRRRDRAGGKLSGSVAITLGTLCLLGSFRNIRVGAQRLSVAMISLGVTGLAWIIVFSLAYPSEAFGDGQNDFGSLAAGVMVGGFIGGADP